MNFSNLNRLAMGAALALMLAACGSKGTDESMATSADSGAAVTGDISGAGATFPYPIYAKWADAYKKETNIGLNYQSIGSGGGIKQIKAKTVTFGASDMPLKPEEVAEAGLVQFPMIIGGVVPVVNVPDVAAGAITLDGATIASMYMGEITMWNDARIKKLNPGLELPALAIAPVYRSDGSGTNFLFSDFLSKSSAKFLGEIGAASAVQWPVGIGAKGNEGVANMTAQTRGAIGYVEYAYAKQNKMTHALLINKNGKAVGPSAQSFQAAAANADWAAAPNFYLILTDQAGDESWPITGASFILMYATPDDEAASTAALRFFDWSYMNGAAMADALDYVPLPDALVQQIRATWKSGIKGATAVVK